MHCSLLCTRWPISVPLIVRMTFNGEAKDARNHNNKYLYARRLLQQKVGAVRSAIVLTGMYICSRMGPSQETNTARTQKVMAQVSVSFAAKPIYTDYWKCTYVVHG